MPCSDKPQSAMITAEESLIDSLRLRLADWVQGELVWYAGSFTIHLLGLSALLLLGNMVVSPHLDDDVPVIVSVLPEKRIDEPPVFLPIERVAPDEDLPAELVIDPTILKPTQGAREEDYIDERPGYKPNGSESKVADSRNTQGSRGRFRCRRVWPRRCTEGAAWWHRGSGEQGAERHSRRHGARFRFYENWHRTYEDCRSSRDRCFDLVGPATKVRMEAGASRTTNTNAAAAVCVQSRAQSSPIRRSNLAWAVAVSGGWPNA